MAKMTATEAAIRVMESEGVELAFGVPGAAILPLYQAMNGSKIKHVLVRHEEGGTHAAEGYTRAASGRIGVCIGTSGPAGTNMITGLYSAMADSIPILCITGQAPRAKLHKEDFQAVDIAAIAKPVTKWAITVMEAAQVPRAFRQAFHLMRSGRPGPVLIDLPIDVQKEIIEYDPDSDFPLEVFKPRPHRKQIEKALDMMMAAQRPLIIAGGGIINADASDLLVELAELTQTPVIPTLMGWGSIPDDHALNAGMMGLQTQHRYGNATFLRSDFVLGIGNRWANRQTGSLDVYTKGRKFVHVDIDPMQIGRVFCPDLGIVGDARYALEEFVAVARARKTGRQDHQPPATGSPRCRSANTPCSGAPISTTCRSSRSACSRKSTTCSATTPVSSPPSACTRSPRASSRRSTSRATTSSAARPARWAGKSRPAPAPSWPIRARKSWAWSATIRSSS